ncbi:hypothetical protein NG829_08365 [Xanthomonas sacchari]|uniref:Secreted protein n=1 Tax=Xanthomonas sacchari TaxID=56458 RepID=A0ABT3DUT7_9XANT|nr:hypothetical protein [Xanthomonas sacchari]MCW0398749.1 hypothetical protein [Xanthomonas sacchari]MCW0418397.1 hypothetical protein [Xanthomonas sacchari]UYK72541.1 hypothetical protein NG828_20530 [Xanthomonas sacchari]UYK82289.1 hypothetical protein NG829_08365 [Xanthomonas sacchari]
MTRIVYVLGLVALGQFVFAAEAGAQCCPSGGTAPPLKAKTGLGEAAPAAANLSADPAWKIYQFERDGVSYLQINDIDGRVRAAVGRVGDTAWVMPVGVDADRVTVSTSSMGGAVAYNSDDFVVRVVSGTDKLSWIVVPLRKP